MAQSQRAASLECFRCNNCGNITLMLKKVCPKCGDTNIQKSDSPGEGEVVDFTTVYYPPDDCKDIAPYTSVLVRLSNGCKLFGVIKGEVKDISPGKLVKLTEHDANTGRLIFQLV